MIYTGACHCGEVRFTVEGTISGVMDCNCSICRKTGFLHWLVEPHKLSLQKGEGRLQAYLWGTGIAKHLFCPVCGVAPLRRPRMRPESFSVNVRCLDGVDLAALEIEACDGEALPLPQPSACR